MSLDISQIPQSPSPFRTKVSLLMQASATVISVLSFVAIIVIVCNKEKKQENGRWQRFEICVLSSVFLSVMLGVFDLFCMSNFLISWDYAGYDSSFVTTVDGYTVILWCISKSAFYVIFNTHIDQYFKSIVDETKRRNLHIVLVVVIICLLIVAVMILYNDLATETENEMLRINEWLIMVNPCENPNFINLLGHAMVACADMTYFVMLTLAYRSVYNSRSNSAQDKDIDRHKITAKHANGLMLLSTTLTLFLQIVVILQIPGRWALVWVGTIIDDLCVVILLLLTHQSLKHNEYSVVRVTEVTEDQEI